MLPKTILVTNPANIRFLSGFSGTSGWLVLDQKKSFLLTDARYHLVAKKVLPRGFRLIDTTRGFDAAWFSFLKKNRRKKIGIEGGNITLRFFKHLKKISDGIEFVDVGNELDERRMVKNAGEIASLQKAQAITDDILKALKKWLRPGVSELEIAWKIECLAREFGADDISFPPIVGINENSAAPHHHNSRKKMKRGDLILLDMGVMWRGYCSDMTRVLFTKKPTQLEQKIYTLVWEAQEAGIKKLRAGITGVDADKAARNIITKAGYGKNFGHSLGHGVGLEIHELPNLSQKYTKKIPGGSVVTVEPGIYLPGKFGVRLEDMLLVGRNGARNLTKSPKAIQENIIRI